MSIQPFDVDTHHVALGPAGDEIGLMIAGAYVRRPQKAAFDKPSDVGTDALISDDREAVWTQKDYSGGEFQREWSDPAMFAKCQHFQPNPLGLSLVSVPPLLLLDGGFSPGVEPKSFDIINQKIYVTHVTADGSAFRLRQYEQISGPTFKPWTVEHIDFDQHPTQRGNCAAWQYLGEKLWVGGTGLAGVYVYTVQNVKNQAGVKTGISLAKVSHLNAPSIDDPVTAIQHIHIFGSFRFIVTNHAGGHDNSRVFNHISGTDDKTKWDGIGTLPGTCVDTITYNNAVYFLTRDEDSRTQLSMTQGSDLFPVLDLPYYFRGTQMIEYAGRLFIVGAGYDLNGSGFAGEIHEVNGTSLRLVRTFRTEARRTDRVSAFDRLRTVGVVEGMLAIPDSTNGAVEFYDATTDGFFGGPALPAGPDPDLDFTGMVTAGSAFFLWGTHRTAAAKCGLYRILEDKDESLPYAPTLETSDFAPEPGRDKVWGRVVALTRYGSPLLEVSDDGGATWRFVGSGNGAVTQKDQIFETVWDVADSGLSSSRRLRLRFTFARAGVPGEGMIEQLAHSLSFSIAGSGKQAWQFQVALAEFVTGVDFHDTVADQTQTHPLIKAQLWTWFQDHTALNFRDRDGVNRRVYISSIEENNPQLTVYNESFVQLDLREI